MSQEIRIKTIHTNDELNSIMNFLICGIPYLSLNPLDETKAEAVQLVSEFTKQPITANHTLFDDYDIVENIYLVVNGEGFVAWKCFSLQ